LKTLALVAAVAALLALAAMRLVRNQPQRPSARRRNAGDGAETQRQPALSG
jgi:hypothetical protein